MINTTRPIPPTLVLASERSSRGMKRIMKLAMGWTFILLGIAGLVLPILQGILFLVIGMSILSTELPWVDRIFCRLKARFPILDKTHAASEKQIRKWRTKFESRKANASSARG